jgi:hypothetical protein
MPTVWTFTPDTRDYLSCTKRLVHVNAQGEDVVTMVGVEGDALWKQRILLPLHQAGLETSTTAARGTNEREGDGHYLTARNKQ